MSQQSSQTGFTLIEVIIVISIMTIVTYGMLTALPVVRTNQYIQGDITQLRALITSAQQQAVNEIRSADCLATVGDSEDLQRRCSNVGVYITNQRLVQFADLSGNQEYDVGDDFILSERTQYTSVGGGSDVSVVFEADPPTVLTYVDGQVLSAGQVVPVTLSLEETERVITIGPYGVVEYE